MTTPTTSANPRRKRTMLVALTALVALALLALSLVGMRPAAAHSQLAAVVNNDVSVEVEGQIVPMGRQLTSELVSLDGPFEWEITTSDRAAAGLKSGRYAAAVTIPPEFSADVTSLSSLSNAVQASVEVEVAPGSSASRDTEVQLEVWKATANLGSMMTEEFVAGVFGGLSEMGPQLQQAADGAQQLADGAEDAQSGATALADGNRALGEGAGQAADGLGQLAAGTDELGAGLGQLAGGAGEAASGASQLAGGLNQLSAGGPALVSGGTQLAQGSQSFTDGLEQYVAGVSEAAGGVNQLNDAVQQLAPILDALKDALGQVDGNVEDLVDQLLAQIEVVLDQLPALLDQHCVAYPDSPLCAPEVRAELDAVLAQWLVDLRAQIEAGLNQQIIAEIQAVLDQINSGVGQIDDLLSGLQQLADGMNQLSTTGTQQLLPGARGITDGMTQYVGGVREYTNGVSQIAAGAGPLAGGIGQLADGANAAASGTGELASGARQAQDGVGQLADGAEALANGTTELGDGLGQLGGGAGELADGLAMAGDAVPNVSEDEASALGEALASPVQTPVVAAGKSAAPAVALGLLLWLASMLLQSVYPPAATYLSSSTRSSAFLALRALRHPALWSGAIGAVGGVIIAIIGSASAGGFFGLLAFGILAGLVFAAVQQALALVLPKGWVTASVAALVIGVSAALAPAGGSALGSLSGMLPAGLAGEVFAGILVPGLGSIAGAAVLLGLWGALAVVISIVATSSKRKNPEVAAAAAG